MVLLCVENLVMTRAQRDKMSIIKHYLYHNPTVLYAPNSSAADNIITKVREFLHRSAPIRTQATDEFT